MPAKGLNLLPFLALAVLAAGPSAAEPVRPMIGATDLRTIVLSPAPLGPAAQIQPATAAAPVPAITVTAPRGRTANTRVHRKTAVTSRRAKGNPLDAFARDIRRQTWPCSGGGICAWTRPGR